MTNNNIWIIADDTSISKNYNTGTNKNGITEDFSVKLLNVLFKGLIFLLNKLFLLRVIQGRQHVLEDVNFEA